MEVQGNRTGRKGARDQDRLIVLPPDMEEDRLFSLAESARYLNCSIDTLRRQYQLGRIPMPVMIGMKKKAYSKRILKEIAQRR